jgi:hypothetical protein
MPGGDDIPMTLTLRNRVAVYLLTVMSDGRAKEPVRWHFVVSLR